MAKRKKELTPMERLTAGHNAFMKGKRLKPATKADFEKNIKQVTSNSTTNGKKPSGKP